MLKRPGWDSYFLLIASVVASRSTCVRRKVGAVLVRGKQILSTGYNGAPKNTAHCDDLGCLREKLGVPPGERHEICRGSHAEINAIAQAAAAGTATQGSWLYCTHEPCAYCAKALINSGCKRIVFVEPYPDKFAGEILKESGVETVIYPADSLPAEFFTLWREH